MTTSNHDKPSSPLKNKEEDNILSTIFRRVLLKLKKKMRCKVKVWRCRENFPT